MVGKVESQKGRYDGVEKLMAFSENGEFPTIHDDIFGLFTRNVDPSVGNVMDLGASVGFLSRRMADAGFHVDAIEPDPASIRAGQEYGLYEGIKVKRWKLAAQDYDELVYWLGAKRIKVVMARRVISELDTAGMTPRLFTDACAAAGVEHLFLEGRAPRQHTTHRLDCLAVELTEIEAFTPKVFDGPHRAYLTPRG